MYILTSWYEARVAVQSLDALGKAHHMALLEVRYGCELPEQVSSRRLAGTCHLHFTYRPRDQLVGFDGAGPIWLRQIKGEALRMGGTAFQEAPRNHDRVL